jgi:predicted CoA-binding protein
MIPLRKPISPDEVDVVVCFRQSEITEAVEGSIEVSCDRCKEAMWMGPNIALFVAARVGTVPVLCLDCLMELADA